MTELTLEQPDEGRMLEVASAAADEARRCGADFADVSITWSRQISVAIEGNNIQLCEQHEPWHCSIRAFVGGGMGLFSSDGPPGDLGPAIEQAIAMARLASPDADFVDLPGPADPICGNGDLQLYDPQIEAMSLADAVVIARDSIDRALAADAGVQLSGDVNFSVGRRTLAGSTGVAISRTGTFADISTFAIVRDGDDVGSFTDFAMARHWDDLRREGLVESTVQSARSYQHARPAAPGLRTLVLGPQATWSLVGSLAGATSAERMRRRRSLLAGRTGQRVASELITLCDCPLEVRGVYSGSADADGAPRRPVTMIDAGVFAEPLNNHYNARLAGGSNNGHGTRTGDVSPTNLQLQVGQRQSGDLIAEVDDGIYLEAGSLSPDPASGDISAILDFARRIEKGELTTPLAGAMVAGNLLDLLSKVDAVSADARRDPGMVMPSVRINKVQISGSA